ncbi:MAG: hypothetical protein LQ339_001921 [Xanthoria mediterranea]|nr:MAG: hypothetical protein LQ339_001921 [Xanthoria mediterranea]
MTVPGGSKPNRTAAVVFGSETGNALDYAEEAGRLLERLHFQTVVTSLDALDPLSLARFGFVVAVISTTGQGDLPANARSFWRLLLRKRLPPDYLGSINFTSFGLGDSSYPRFNWAARKFHKRLIQLGAHEFLPRGEGDEQHEEGLDATWVPWSAELRRQVLLKYPLGEGLHPIPEDVLLQPKCLLSLASNDTPRGTELVCNGSDAFPIVNGIPIPDGTTPVQPAPLAAILNTSDHNAQHLIVKVKQNRRLTPQGHWQDVRHLELSCPASIKYNPGDVLTIYPQNSLQDVDQIIELMGWDPSADQPVQFESTNNMEEADFYPVPPAPSNKLHSKPLTLRKVLIHYLDMRAIPRRSFFSTIAHFTNDDMHKERLLEFTDPQYIDELYDYTTRPRRSILEVLQEFDSVKIPWQWAANVLPKLRGRQFSIASGGSCKCIAEGQTNFELLAAIVRYKTVLKRLREGVCTRYITGLEPGTTLNVTLQKGGLGVHESEATRPVIMVGPGTGVAPMRSLIWERYHWQQDIAARRQASAEIASGRLKGIGETVLFYGGRNQEADFYYHQEWDFLEKEMPLQVFAAFSRDQPAKVYVQDILKQQSELVYKLLYYQDGIVYVCGASGKMPRAVRAALVEIFVDRGIMDSSAAEDYLQAMEKEGRYKQETW